MSVKTRMVIKTAFITFLSSVFLLVVGGLITAFSKGCTGLVFDAAAQNSAFIPRYVDSCKKQEIKKISRRMTGIEIEQIKMRCLYESSIRRDQIDCAMTEFKRDSAVKMAEINSEETDSQ